MNGRGGRALLLVLLWLAAAPASAALSPRENPVFATPAPGTPAMVTVGSEALIEKASAWDRRVVSFAGEAVGEAMMRGDHAWLHVNDDASQVRNFGQVRPLIGYNRGQAVWVPLALARRVRRFGDYRNAGDLVRVSGEFHAACREHGGDMDIHATGLEIVREGHAVGQQPSSGRLGIGLGLLVLAGVLRLLCRRQGRDTSIRLAFRDGRCDRNDR